MVKLKIRTEITKHIRLIGLLFLVLFVVIAFRAYSLQVIRAPELQERLKIQLKKKVPLEPKRGTIYDRNSRELSVSVEVDSLFARLRVVKDKKETARELSSILGISQDKLLSSMKNRAAFVWIKRKTTPDQAERIKALNLEGIGFIKESQRFYPNKDLAGQVLGCAGVDSQGLEGLEREYDHIIKGKQGYVEVERDALGRDLYPEGIKTVASIRGYDLVLTIDRNIQYIAERELQAAVTTTRAKGGLAVVMEPATGEILAMAVAPSVNPNQMGSVAPELRKNRIITDVFEPGSIFKIFVVASALEERVIKPEDSYYCENGKYPFAGKVIHDVHPHGLLSVTEVIKYSSNIGATKISQHVGRERFYQYIRKFGFGEESGIELPGEVSGAVPVSDQWREINLGTISFGQGISVTALQIVGAYAAIANGGVLMRPHVVKRVQDENGRLIQETLPQVSRRVISEQTARTLTGMLETVVQKGGTGQKAAVDSFLVAGKTGTAQKIAANGKGYSNKTVSSFVGFVPADTPKLAILVIIDEPKGVTYGGVTAAPAFSKMAYQILCYLHIYPEPSMQKVEQQQRWQETKSTSAKNETPG